MQFSYVASTHLPMARVWQFVADMENWPSMSKMYVDLSWVGEPLMPASYLQGRVRDEPGLEIRHEIRTNQSPSLLRLLSHGSNFGFAVESTIRLEELDKGTLIHIEAYAVANPACDWHGGSAGFLTILTQGVVRDFARFCELEECGVPHEDGSFSPHTVVS